jgi:hypothetical protein
LVDRSAGGEDPYIEICEVYYDELGKPLGYCPAAMGGENKEEIKTYIEWALEALEKPVIYFGEIIGEE